MSGIAGIYNLDGRPIDFQLLRRMTEAIAHRGPDGVGYWGKGSVGVGHRLLQTTPESLLERQPLTDEAGDLCLTLDGRVDNREELRTALEAKGVQLRDDTDAELVLRAYEGWDEECPRKILGDFAFAIWDRRKQQLFCARDPVGWKPFYYCTDGRRFLWGSELRALLEDDSLPREPNEEVIAEYLAHSICSKEETLFRGILRLPPGYFLVVGPGRFRKVRYWDIDPDREIRYSTDEEYAEHFLEIFQEAVRCRLRSHHVVGADLSGGLDSSSVVGVAQRLYQEGLVANPGMETFSLLFAGLPCDESPFIQEVVGRWGLSSHGASAAYPDVSCYPDQVRRYYDFPNFPNGQMHDPVMALVQNRGVRVLLSGLGGDQWLAGSFYHHADLLRRLRILEVVRQSRSDATILAHYGSPKSAYWLVLRYGLGPLLPPTLRRAAKRVLRREQNGVPRWIGSEFARRTGLSDRLRVREAEGKRFSSHVRRGLSHYLTSGWSCFQRQLIERYTTGFGLEYRHPFYDLRLIEYALAIPETQRWRREQTKFVLRHAMQGLLPDAVRQRPGKADFSHVFPETLYRLGGERLMDSLATVSQGWVEGKEVRQMYSHMATHYTRGNSDYYSRYMWALWMIFGIDLWFKTVFWNETDSFCNASSLPQVAIGVA